MTARKTHIIRLYKDDDTESDTWIDIERLDELYFESGRGPQYREKRWKFDWDNFDPDRGNVTKKQIVDPEDEENFIEVPVRNSVFVREARGDQYYSYKKKFLNDDSNQRRETVSRQVFHHDIPDEYLDEDGQPPSDPNDYLESLGDQDMDQYVEVELLAKYWTDQKDHHDAQGKIRSASAWQDKKWLYNDDDVDPLLRDPMLETDQVDPGFVPVNNPIDGPIVDPPWRLDPLQNIVNVQWGGGDVFIAGDFDSYIYYLKPGGNEPAWQNLGKLDFYAEEDGFITGGVAGSAYAKVGASDDDAGVPVFILVGGFGVTGEIGIIMTSSDGLNWSRVFTFRGNPDPALFKSAGIFGVLWNEEAQTFYAGGHQSDSSADPLTGDIRWTAEIDILFQSDDGYTWNEISRYEMRIDAVAGVFPPYPDYKTGLLVEHCSTLVKDSNNNGIPDGNYGYDKASELLIAPATVLKIDYLFGNYLTDIPQSSFSVTVTSLGGGEAPSYPSNVEIPVTCTATAGGKWMAAGGVLANRFAGEGRSQAAILTSSEDGYFWQSLDPSGTNVIVTMVGGKARKNGGSSTRSAR